MKLSLSAAVFCVSCSGLNAGTVVSGIDDVSKALCVLEHYATDTLAGKSWNDTLTDIEQSCKVTEGAATAVIAEHNKASDAEGAARKLKDAGSQ